MYRGLYVKYLHYCQILIKLEFHRQIFERYWSMKFLENSSSGSRVVPCGRMDRHGEVIVAFRNVGEAPKIVVQLLHLMGPSSLRRNSPHWAVTSSFLRFLDHTQRGTTVGRTPLDEWSARRRDLYLTSHNTHNRQTSMSTREIRTHNSNTRGAADPPLRPRGHWCRL
jgi:hypothetical protein